MQFITLGLGPNPDPGPDPDPDPAPVLVLDPDPAPDPVWGQLNPRGSIILYSLPCRRYLDHYNNYSA